jgi:V/A-type H+-transporting ATPase subunit I
MQLLINMFGLPHYRSLDPTPFLTFTFLIFFGCCFGDVVYGLALMAMSGYVVVRYRHAAWTRNFFQFFLYSGIFATVFGLITGTWMGDLLTNAQHKYVSGDNPLVRFAEACALLDPMQKPLIALLIALGLGVANQFYGIGMKMAIEFRRKNPVGALLDGGLWLVFLPGMIIAIAPMFAKVPPALVAVGWWLLGIGAVGLVLTQGRGEQGFLGKAITGVVSLYGILGGYGATSFIGDVLSYSRLLALGLTTTIIAISFNIIAALFRDIPMAGPLLFVLALAAGHVFNFMMSILGSFVHPARLVLLEFFNRFYEGGGRAFRPLAFSSERVAIVKDKMA